MLKVCAQCGKQFTTSYSKKKFCCRECLFESRRLHRKYICPVCRKEFEPKKKKQKFCSIQCANKFQQSCIDIDNTKTRIHQIWTNMKTRCLNPNVPAFKDYGGRGISVCEEWMKSFSSFYHWALQNGYSTALTLDRIDVNGNYEPSNCKWSTKEEQSRNRRFNRRITYNGKNLTIGEWAKEVNLTWNIIAWRLDSGWSIEEALFTPRMLNHEYTCDHEKLTKEHIQRRIAKYNKNME